MALQQRRHFRIKYPEKLRPELIVNGQIHLLIDVSEGGLRFLFSGPYVPDDGSEFTATLGFRTGARITVKGLVLRSEGKQVMVQLNQGVPRNILKAEADLLLEQVGQVPTETY